MKHSYVVVGSLVAGVAAVLLRRHDQQGGQGQRATVGHPVTVPSALDDADLLFHAPKGDVGALYDRAADRYDHSRDLWLRLAGARAEQGLLEDLRRVLHPGATVLDADAAPEPWPVRSWRSSRPLSSPFWICRPPRMLAKADDVPGDHIVGSVLDLPFPDASFDIVLSGWVIETVPDPIAAVAEYLRVINPGGSVLYTFCSLPQGFFFWAGSAWLQGAVKHGFAGQFLPEERTPWHGCDRSHRLVTHGGLATHIAAVFEVGNVASRSR